MRTWVGQRRTVLVLACFTLIHCTPTAQDTNQTVVIATALDPSVNRALVARLELVLDEVGTPLFTTQQAVAEFTADDGMKVVRDVKNVDSDTGYYEAVFATQGNPYANASSWSFRLRGATSFPPFCVIAKAYATAATEQVLASSARICADRNSNAIQFAGAERFVDVNLCPGAAGCAASDAGTDAGVDAGMDAGASTDAGEDAGPAVDGGADASTDAGQDAGTAPDSGADAGQDAGTAPDAGVDAGVVTPLSFGFGFSHSCAVMSDSTARCWGENGTYGSVGSGTAGGNQPTPGLLVNEAGDGGLAGVLAIAAGLQHSCAILDGGYAVCWGRNDYGALGYGDAGTATWKALPVRVRNENNTGTLTGVVALSAGDYVSCALLTSGRVRCWGYGSYGGLGNNQTSNGPYPVIVQNGTDGGELQGALEIASGGNHSCALMPGGTARCWGDNAYGQVGDGTSSNTRLVPTAVSVVSDIQSIHPGWGHTCARIDGGTIKCWGYGPYGQLGNDAGSSSAASVLVIAPASATALAVRGHFGCATFADAGVRCWGYNAGGQLGNDTTSSSKTMGPVLLDGGGELKGVEKLTAGGQHVFGIRSDGQIFGWGDNTKGQLGFGTTGTLEKRAIGITIH